MPSPRLFEKVDPDLIVQAACFVAAVFVAVLIISENLTASHAQQEGCRAVTAHANTAAI